MSIIKFLKRKFAGAAADIGPMNADELLEAIKNPIENLSRSMVEGWEATLEDDDETRFNHCALKMTADGAYVMGIYFKAANVFDLYVRPSAHASVSRWTYNLGTDYDEGTPWMAQLFEDRPQIAAAASYCVGSVSSWHRPVAKVIDFWSDTLQRRRDPRAVQAQPSRSEAQDSGLDWDAGDTTQPSARTIGDDAPVQDKVVCEPAEAPAQDGQGVNTTSPDVVCRVEAPAVTSPAPAPERAAEVVAAPVQERFVEVVAAPPAPAPAPEPPPAPAPAPEPAPSPSPSPSPSFD